MPDYELPDFASDRQGARRGWLLNRAGFPGDILV